jgi:hypothetical protein
MLLAFSSSRRRCAESVFPARLMKNWIMRMPDPIPFGLTRLLAIVRAIVRASLLNSPGGGAVETMLTLCDHFRFVVMSNPRRATKALEGVLKPIQTQPPGLTATCECASSRLTPTVRDP